MQFAEIPVEGFNSLIFWERAQAWPCLKKTLPFWRVQMQPKKGG
jgi:hypothetical protein